MKNSINEIVEEAKQLYCMQTQRLYLEDKKKENNLIKQYKGREIYELLQNIDDAAEEGKECIASIKFDENFLIISNNGKPFTISTLQRLCQGGVSEKDDKYIGCKGIGFRSVLNWADEISIYSGDDISVKFSREYAQNIYNELITGDAKEHIKNQSLELKRRGYDSSYPIFRAPQHIDRIKKEFDTVIKLKIKESLKSSIKNSLEDIDENILLFLPKLVRIVLDFNGIQNIYEKTIQDKKFTISKTINGDKSSTEFFVNNKECSLKKEFQGSNKLGLCVAIPCEDNQIKPKLYSFFPILGLNSPFPAFLHATFLLTDNRNDLDLSNEEVIEANKEIFKTLIEFYVNTVVNNISGDRRLQLLTPFNIPSNINDSFKFNESIGKLELEETFINLCKEKDIFYTVNQQYIKAIENPIILDTFPENNQFTGEKFKNVIKYIPNSKLRGFAKRLIGSCNPEGYLCEAINNSSGSWDVDTRIKTFNWWNSQGYTQLPNLLKTINGHFLSSKDEPCFLSEEKVPEWVRSIPAWANISVLSDEDQKALINCYDSEINEKNEKKGSSESNKRVLPRLINKNLVDIQEQSSRQVVISPINNSIKGENEHERAVEFIKWLWEVWKDKPFDETIKNKIKFNVPTKVNTVSYADKVYLGNDYDNELGKKILEKIEGYSELTTLNIEGASMQDKKSFFYDLGISIYPRLKEIKKEKVDNLSIEGKFVDYVLKHHSHEELEKISQYNTCLYSIENLEKILDTLDTQTIIKWIFTDQELKNAILNETQSKYFYIEYWVKHKWYPKKLNNEYLLPSYVRFVFSNTPWIEINNNKYRPIDLIIARHDLSDYSLNNLLESDIENLSKNICSVEELHSLLIILGVKTSYLELEPEQFYNLLLSLPGKDRTKAIRISRDIYRTIIDSSANVSKCRILSDYESDRRNTFLEEGKVLVKKSNNSEFVSIAEAFFSSSAVINTDGKFPIDVPARRGKRDDFEKILGIKPYEIDYNVISKIESHCNSEFQRDFYSFIPCIMCYRNGKKDEIVNLSVELVSYAKIKYNNQEKIINSGYILLKKSSRHWLICVGEETDYKHLAKERIAENLVQIFNVLFNFPSKDFLNKVEQLFIYNQTQREYLIESEFGGKDEIENTKLEIKNTSEFYKKISDFLNTSDDGIKNINWMNPDLDDLREIVNLLKDSQKPLNELNKLLDSNISIVKYNSFEFIKEYENDKVKVRADIYEICKNEPKTLIDKWKTFDEMIKAYTTDFEKLDFNKKDAYRQLKDDFYKKHNIKSNNERTYNDITKIYRDNLNKIKKIFDNNSLSVNDFTNISEYDSLLYFKDSNLECIVDEFIKNEVQKQEELTKLFNNNQYNIEELINKIELDSNLLSGTKREIKTNVHKGAVTTSKTAQLERKNKYQGNWAEYIVICLLEEEKFKEVNEFLGRDYSIYWVSGAAKEIQDLETKDHKYDCTNTNDSVGYDIELISNDKSKRMYIEVKSSSQENCSFYMSANEREVAITKNNENERYRIIFVSNLDINNSKSIPKAHFINAPLEDAFNAYPIQYNMVYNKTI